VNYYERHLGDYAKNASHLSMLEHGAYTLLLDRYYGTEEPIPADQAYRVARAHSKEERAAVDSVLQEFFTLNETHWVHGRCQEEIEKAHKRIAAARTNGVKGGRPKTNPAQAQQEPNGLEVGSISGTQSKALQSPDSNLQTPISRKREDRARALADARAVRGVNLVAFDRWIGYRDERKPSVKTISLVAAAEQLAKFGDDEMQAKTVQHSIANGYQGLVPPKLNGNGAQQPAAPIRYRTAEEYEAEERARGDHNEQH
jgi:uncharacterized protein YdaU (DUF1376 family)